MATTVKRIAGMTTVGSRSMSEVRDSVRTPDCPHALSERGLGASSEQRDCSSGSERQSISFVPLQIKRVDIFFRST